MTRMQYSFLAEERELGATGAAERGRRQLGEALGDACAATRELEQLVGLLSEDAVRTHAGVEVRIVQAAVAHAADTVQHLFLAVRIVALTP